VIGSWMSGPMVLGGKWIFCRSSGPAQSTSMKAIVASSSIAGAVLIALPFAWPVDKPAVTAKELVRRDLVGVPGKELRLVEVTYPPGVSSPPHQHHAQVTVYVVEGSVKMQAQGGPLVTLGPGETFEEGIDDVHAVSANASDSAPARFVAFIIQDKQPAAPK